MCKRASCLGCIHLHLIKTCHHLGCRRWLDPMLPCRRLCCSIQSQAAQQASTDVHMQTFNTPATNSTSTSSQPAKPAEKKPYYAPPKNPSAPISRAAGMQALGQNMDQEPGGAWAAASGRSICSCLSTSANCTALHLAFCMHISCTISGLC